MKMKMMMMMNGRTTSCSCVAASCLIITALLLFAFCELGFCRVEKGLVNLGAIRDIPQNDLQLETLARFALQQHNKKQNSLLKFGRLVKAKEQVVAGIMYYFTLEADDAGETKKEGRTEQNHCIPVPLSHRLSSNWLSC
ncbi:hypothetical protein QVD17_17794 [Tagetes erecta]|uniref:Cysteine proteinase inhibitor n=1 Tax=Tagetes erecta TaxID=13708 RepID=A0AAD8KTX0_TARER|nr:hypothetical protein QVD17_17794 [Tagetes erecta]